MKHATKEAIATIGFLTISCLLTYPSVIYLLFMWDQEKSDPVMFYSIVAGQVLSVILIYTLFQWVRRK